MPTLTIDGQEITVDRGTTILQAAAELGIEIPTFCYHPGLSIVANCRMCLVETNKSPKPLPACHAQVMDGMEVQTKTDEVKKTQKSVLEFILLNHPVDCPICDQAGECVLQDHYFNFSAQPSRLYHRKQHKAKAKVLGPNVILDAERCILCTRCIRFCDEVAKDSQLEIMNRGEHSEITTFPGKELDNPYATNVVDICPVGALTSREFRFRTRVWMLQSADSACPECSRNCKIRVDTFENVPRRYKPAYNPKVNDWWMCDHGRASFSGLLDNRMEGPTIQSDEGKRYTVDTKKATQHAADVLRAASGGANVTVIVTPWLTNEDAFLVAKLLAGPLAGASIYMGGREDGKGDDVLIRADKNPNRAGVTEILTALGVTTQPLSEFAKPTGEAALIFGDEHSFSDAQLGALAGFAQRIVIGSFLTPLWRASTVFLPARIHTEKDGTFTNFEGIVQRLNRATRAASTCKSEGWYAMQMVQALGGAALNYKTAAEVFQGIALEVPLFAGMRHDTLGRFGQTLGEGAEEAAEAADSATPAAPTEAP